MDRDEDKRPDPKPRKHPQLWQSYLWYHELTSLRMTHERRIGTIEAGKSNMDATVERNILELMPFDALEKLARKQMCSYGQASGPIWDWLTSIRGLGSDYLPAQLIAQIDDISKFATVSKLGRFCGVAVIDGRAEYGTPNYNRRLKSLLLGPSQIGDQFVRQHAMPYREIYDDDKERLYRLHPVPLCRKCKIECVRDSVWRCPGCGATNKGCKLQYTPGHIDSMARRKMVKMFLQHLWVRWRTLEGLPTGEPYAQAILGHTGIIPPPGGHL